MTTTIEWTDETWNPTTGCTRVSEGCRGCYIERTMPFRLDGRRFTKPDGTPGTGDVGESTGLVFHPERIALPLKWKKPRRVFVNSLSDLFHKDVLAEMVTDRHGASWPLLAELFAVMARTPQHTYQILTKRPQIMAAVLLAPRFRMDVNSILLREAHPVMPGGFESLWPANIWLGTSVEDQKTADLRVPHLVATPGAVRFISAEPLLAPVDLFEAGAYVTCRRCAGRMSLPVPGGGTACPDCLTSPGGQGSASGIHWVIVGGESGPGARPMHPEWARSLRDQCVAAGVPFFFKQWGEWRHATECSDFDVEQRMKRAGTLAQWDRYRVEVVLPDGTITADNIPVTGSASMMRVGKKHAGRDLDGRTWDEYPVAADA